MEKGLAKTRAPRFLATGIAGQLRSTFWTANGLCRIWSVWCAFNLRTTDHPCLGSAGLFPCLGQFSRSMAHQLAYQAAQGGSISDRPVRRFTATA